MKRFQTDSLFLRFLRLTSLMFLFLLGIATCETICVKTIAATTVCPTSDKTVDAVNKLAAEIKTAGTIIYTDVALDASAKLTDAHLKNIIEIKALNSATALECTVTVGKTTTSTLDVLTLSGIELAIAVDTTPGKKLLANEKVTVKSLNLLTGSTVTLTDVTLDINDLLCDSFASATADIIKLPKTSFTLKGKDLADKIEIPTTGDDLVTLTGTGTPATLGIPKTLPKTTFTNIVTKDTTLKLVGDFTGVEPTKFSTILEFGNDGPAILTFGIDSAAPTPSTKKLFTSNTYTKFGTGFTAQMQAMITLNTTFALDDNDKRVNVPQSAVYCIDKALKRAADCPETAQVLWTVDEVAKMSNGADLITLDVSGYSAANDNLVVDLSKFKTKPIKFTATDGTTQQNIQIDLTSKDQKLEGDFQFELIKLIASYAAATTGDAKVSFTKLLVRKSSIVSAVKDPSSKILKAVTLSVNAADLTSDPVSLKNTKFSLPTKFTVIDVTSAEFSGDAKSVKFNGGTEEYTKDEIAVPFIIATLPDQKVTTPVELTIAKNGEKPGTALGFSFDLPADSELTAKYSGDWSANKIIVNVAKGATFNGINGTDVVLPTMNAQGEGVAKLDGKDIPKPEQPGEATPTPKGGLSGGAIAGIVIACVVVVAAVVVVVVVVIKKKKGKVAN